MNTDRIIFENAREIIKAFAKSDQELPSPKMVTAVNDYISSYVDGHNQITVQSAIFFRRMAAIQMSLSLIRALSVVELEKAEKAIYSIVETFAYVRWVDGEWRAYVAHDRRTADRVIDEQTAKDFCWVDFRWANSSTRYIPMDYLREHKLPTKEAGISDQT